MTELLKDCLGHCCLDSKSEFKLTQNAHEVINKCNVTEVYNLRNPVA
jgi:hypothetical protein